MPKACELKLGSLVRIGGAAHVVEDLRVSTPSARGASSLYRFRFRNILSKNKLDQTCKGDDKFDEIDFEKRPVQFLYAKQDRYTFMDLEDFSQFELPRDALEDQVGFLVENMEDLQALVIDGQPAAIELPQSVTLAVAACDPSLRGQTVTSRTKPATLSTGLVVQVPEYITPGEVIRVDTRTREFGGRA